MLPLWSHISKRTSCLNLAGSLGSREGVGWYCYLEEGNFSCKCGEVRFNYQFHPRAWNALIRETFKVCRDASSFFIEDGVIQTVHKRRAGIEGKRNSLVRSALISKYWHGTFTRTATTHGPQPSIQRLSLLCPFLHPRDVAIGTSTSPSTPHIPPTHTLSSSVHVHPTPRRRLSPPS